MLSNILSSSREYLRFLSPNFYLLYGVIFCGCLSRIALASKVVIDSSDMIIAPFIAEQFIYL